MKKLLFALFGLLVITSCSKEHEPLPTPQVSIEAPAGTDPTQPIALTLGGTLALKAVSANTRLLTSGKSTTNRSDKPRSTPSRQPNWVTTSST